MSDQLDTTVSKDSSKNGNSPAISGATPPPANNPLVILPPSNNPLVILLPSNNPPAVQQQESDIASGPIEQSFHTAIILLAAIVLLVVIATILVTFLGKSLSEGALAIGSTAVGGLAGIVIPRARK